MKKIKKKAACILVACSGMAAVISTAPTQVFAQGVIKKGVVSKASSQFTFQGLEYEITTPDTGSGGIAKVLGVKTPVATMNIPTTATTGTESYTITEVADNAFAGVRGIQKITMADTVKDIGIMAFAGCADVEDIQLSNSLTSIPSDAFSQNPKLASIFIPDNVTRIGGSAFDNDTGLKRISVPELLNHVDMDAFLMLDTVFEVRSAQVMSTLERSDIESILTNNTGLAAFSFLYGEITSIQVKGSTKPVGKGGSVKLAANSTSNATWVGLGVDWQIQGATSKQTTLTATTARSANDMKTLTIGADETATSIKVKVTSQFDSSKSSTVIVTVANPHANPTFTGIKDETISINTAFDPMKGVQAFDDAHTDITASIKVTGTVDTTKPGTYTLTYTVTDVNGLSETATRKITVQKAPVVHTAPTFSGIKNETISINTAFDAMKGIQAFDDVHTDITASIKVTGSVDITKPGTYTLTYTVTDVNGLTTIATRKITVTNAPIAHTAPTFTGIKDETISINTTFDAMKGIQAFDDAHNDITASIKVSGTVDITKPGTYTLTYTVIDANGLKTVVTRKITVAKAPIVHTAPTLTGIKDETISVNTAFDPMKGISAKDAVGNDITANISVTGKVETTKPGVYTLTYLVKDASGNQTTMTRKITVTKAEKEVKKNPTSTTSTPDKRSVKTGDILTQETLYKYIICIFSALSIMVISFLRRRQAR